MTMEPLTISVVDAAKMLGVGRTLIYAMISNGRLATVKLGRRTLITTASMHQLVANQLSKP